MILGNQTIGSTPLDLPADAIVLSDIFEVPFSSFLAGMSVYVDGNGPAAAAQLVRAVLYNPDGRLVAAGSPTVVANDRDAGWIPLPMAAVGAHLAPPGGFRLGLHAGATGNGARVFVDPAVFADATVITGVPFGAGAPAMLSLSGAIRRVSVHGSAVSLIPGVIAPIGRTGWTVLHLGGDDVELVDNAGGTVGTGVPLQAGRSFSAMTDADEQVWAISDIGGASLAVSAAPLGGIPFSIYATALEPIRIPSPLDVDDDYLSSLPFDLTQRVFGASGPIRGEVNTALAGWYGTAFDASGSRACAVVRTDGPLAGLLGERVAVTVRQGALRRTAYAYVTAQRDFPPEVSDEDILLAARVFLALADQALDSIPVSVQVLA